MTDLTRGEFDARLSAAEARTEAQFIRTEAQFVALKASIELVSQGLEKVSADNRDLRGEMRELRGEVRDELREVKADNKNTRWTIALTVVTAVLAGAAAIWTTQNNLLAAFQAGLAERSIISSAAAAPLETAPARPAQVTASPPPAARAR